MTQNNNFSVLPWYNNINEQNHRKSYAYGSIYPLFTPINTVLPFQITRQHRAGDVTSVLLKSKNGTTEANITSAMKSAGLRVVSFDLKGYDIIVFPSNVSMGIGMSTGIHYLELSDGSQTWYSDMFTAVNNMGKYLKVEWYDIENFQFDAGEIVYRDPAFKNRVYFCSELGRPSYEFEEEGENRNGYFFVEKQISYKKYKFTALAPEYLCDVMRFIRMSDYIYVTDQYGRVYDCDSFLITPRWQANGDLASIEVEFQTDTIAKKIGKGYEITKRRGDFNNDYNEDYLISKE